MTVLATSRTASLFISVGFLSRLSTHYPRRGEKISMLTPPASAPLILPNHLQGLPKARKGRGRDVGGGFWVAEELGGSYDLETEIYEFMEMSANPMVFPCKDDLIAAGREDLVRAIGKERGWLAFGWDSDEENEEAVDRLSDEANARPCEGDSKIFQHKMVSVEVDPNNLLSSSEDSSDDSSSGSSIDTDVSRDSGIEGISIYLEKERSLAFGYIPKMEKELMFEMEESHSMIDRGYDLGNMDNWSIEGYQRSVTSNIGQGSHHHSRSPNSHQSSLVDAANDSEFGTWKSWSIQRSGDPLNNFEAAEIVFDKEQKKSELNFVSQLLIRKKKENVSDVQLATGVSSRSNCPYDNDLGSLKNEISVFLQHLDSQLTSAFKLFKCRTYGVDSYKDEDKESLLKELHKLSYALEFQQNEIKKARDLLRSTRAKLAVIEGKITLEVIESQKSVEKKQKRLHAADMALCILRCVWVVWPNSASEVFLSGSFDGWTNQWRMEKKKPRSREFSLCLKLYPGRYEIKFIVDGVWTVDKLLPIVSSNGFQNNLLVVN